MKYEFKDLYLEIITNCNLNCNYCYNHANLSKHKYINLNELEAIIKFCNKYDIKHITISGGEPLLHKQIESIIKRFFQCNIKITIISNLLLLNERILDLLNQNECIIVCSVDTYSLTEKSLLKLEETVSIFNSIKHKIVFSVTIHGQSVTEIRKLFQHIQSKKIKVTINNNSYSEKYLIDLINILHEFSNKLYSIESELYTTAVLNYMLMPKKYCMANKIIKINPYLNIFPCPLTVSTDEIIGYYDYLQHQWLINDDAYENCNLKYYGERRSECILCEFTSKCAGCCYFNNGEGIDFCYLKAGYKTLEEKKYGKCTN